MSITCTACNSDNRDEARYCNRCGARLDGAEEGGTQRNRPVELRQVTVLFCDIVQSTELANQLDPEDLLAVFNEFRHIVRTVARAHSGYRLRFVGDGGRVIFGHPDTREDATESAVRCGLALVRAVRTARPVRDPIDLRVGIAFGTAVLGDEIEETAHTSEAVVGTVAHLAARLVAAAPPGGVVIDHSTRKLIGGFFDCQDLGMLRLKGFEDGVRSWLVLGETSIASRHEARRTRAAVNQVIGRDTELARLKELWAEAAAGRGRAAILVGDPGVGKSRLAHALDEVAQVRGATRLEFDCTPRTRNTALYPVSLLARRLAGIEPADGDDVAMERGRSLLAQSIAGARLDSAMHYLGPLFTFSETVPSAAGESAELIRERTIGFILDVVAASAERAPLIVQFEDLQWSDPTTATLLQRLLKRSSELSILTIVTARPEADIRPLELPHVDVLWLQSLGDVASCALIGQVAEGENLSQRTLEWIIERGEGVPLYLEELTRTVVEAAARPASPESDPSPVPDIPETLQNVIQARLDRRPALRGTTQAAAVLGREFSLPLLQEVLGCPAPEVHNAVARRVDDGIFSPPDPGKPDHARFKHALIQDAVYNTLLRSERQLLHSRVSDILLDQLAGTPESSPDVVAYHLRSALRFEDCVRCLMAASADNISKAAYMEAIGHSRAGLALIDSIDEATRTILRRQLLIQLGVALSATSGYAAAEVEESYRQARALCEEHSEPGTLYPIVRGLATFHLVRGDLALAHEVSLQCMTLADEARRVDLMIDALCIHGYTTYYFGSLVDCRTILERCLALYHAEGGERFTYPVPQDAATAAWALLPTVAWLLGDSDACEMAIAAGLGHVERLARAFDAALLHAWIAGTRYTQRRYREAARHARTSAEISQRFGFRTWLATSATMGYLAESALEPSPHSVSKVVELCSEFAAAGIGLNASYYLLGIARGLARVGDVAGAQGALAEAFRRAEGSNESRMNAELMIFHAELETDDQIALQQLSAALSLADEQGAVATALRAALEILLRAGGGSFGLERARTSLSRLDFACDDPLPADWMREELRKAWQALPGELSATAVG